MANPNLSAEIPAELVAKVEDIVQRAFPSSVAELGKLVRIPGLAWPSFDPENLEASARAVAGLIDGTGLFEKVHILRSKYTDETTGKELVGAPAVVARRDAANGAPQVLLYAHHDVQPPGDETIWKTPAFEPTLVNGRIYGRGAADDKAGIMVHVTALNVLRELLGDKPDLGVTVFIEGEEEYGSPSFSAFLQEHKALLQADVIVVADSGNWTSDIPALTTTLRGMTSVEFTVSTLDHAVHSGMYGGLVPDAMTAMLRTLASLHAADGSVAIEGLVSGVADDIDYGDDLARTDSGILDGVDFIGSGSIVDRLWAKPAVTVIGIDAVSVEKSSNTLLPSIHAKVSLRLAPGDTAENGLARLKEHLAKNLPFGARIEFGAIEQGKGYKADTDGWAAQLVKAALGAAFPNPAIEMGIGGSIPFIAELVDTFPAAQILVTGVEDADSRAHSPNESVDLLGLQRAMVAEALLLVAGNDRR